MAKSSDKSKAANPRISETLRSEWFSRRPVLKFVLLFGLLMVVFYVIYMSSFFTRNIMDPVVEAYAWISAGILKIFGQQTSSSRDVVSGPGYILSIKGGCDALEAMALLVSATAAFPMTWKTKIPGILTGIGFLFLMNVIRIVSLYLIGTYYPSAFDLFHLDIWQVVFIILALISFLVWIQWAEKYKARNSKKPANPNSGEND